jgi:probable phosphoglycerate mutase
VIVEADGGARGNPGPAGYGAVVLDADSGEVLAQRLGALGTATNNVAEYRGLIAGLAAAAELGADEVEVRMDSKLVVEQMSGRWQIKHPGLRPLAAEAAKLVRQFRTVRFTWIPRERNKRADALANAAMDGKPAPEEPSPAPVDEERRVAGPDSPGRAAARAVAAAATAPAPVAATAPAAAPTPAPAGSWTAPVSEATRLVLVRHGETGYTARRLYSGRGDVPLTPRGQEQAAATAARVAAATVTAVVTSPLSRCVATARAIAGAAGGLPVHEDADLIECDFGKWEGHTFAEVGERWPAEMRAWLASPSVAPPGGESFDEVAARTRRALARIREAYPAGRVVVVSHVSPIKLILRDALDGGPAFLHRCYLDPGGISTVDFWPDAGVAVRAVNETAHLGVS